MYMNKISGVYKITNKITSDFYIGSSKNINRRWITHKSPSNWARHPNSKLYQDMAQYGLDNFGIEILEETNNLHEKEQYFISLLCPTYNKNRANGYDFDRYKDTYRNYYNEHHIEIIEKSKEYNEAHKEEHKNRVKNYRKNNKAQYNSYQNEYMYKYQNRICLYMGETITLQALARRFRKQGIDKPTAEAKKYLVSDITN